MVRIKIVCLPCATEIYKLTTTSEIRIDESSTLELLKNDNIFNHIEASGAWKGLYTELYRTSGDKAMTIFVEGNAEDVSRLKLAAKKVGNKYNIVIEEICKKAKTSVNQTNDLVEYSRKITHQASQETIYDIERIFIKYRILFNNIRRLVDLISQHNNLRQSECELQVIDRDIFAIKREATYADMNKISALTLRIADNIKNFREYIKSLCNSAKQTYLVNNREAKGQFNNVRVERQKAALNAVSQIEMNVERIDGIIGEFTAVSVSLSNGGKGRR